MCTSVEGWRGQDRPGGPDTFEPGESNRERFEFSQSCSSGSDSQEIHRLKVSDPCHPEHSQC